MKQSTKYIFAFIAVLFAISFFFAWLSGGMDSLSTSEEPEISSLEEASYADTKGEAYDKLFLAGLSDQLQTTIAAASLSAQASQRDEIKSISTQLINESNTFLTQVQQWQNEWKLVPAEDDIKAPAANDVAGKLVDLSGEAYDQAFLQQLMSHSRQTVEIAKYSAPNAQREDVKIFSANIIDKFESLIEDMQTLSQNLGY